MKGNCSVIALLTGILATDAYAVEFPLEKDDSYTFVSTLSIGPALARGGSDSLFFVHHDMYRYYNAHHQDNLIPVGEIFAGIATPITPEVMIHAGVELATTGNAKLQGIIIDPYNLAAPRPPYSYKVRNTRASLKGKLMGRRGKYVLPWAHLSVGAGFNLAFDYRTEPLPNNQFNPVFSDHSKLGFAITTGCGLETILSPNWQVGVGYEFSDWGMTQLDRATNQTVHTGIKTRHIYTSGLMFNLTFMA